MVPDEAVTVAVSLDGVMVPMKDGKRADKRERSRAAGRRAKGPAGYPVLQRAVTSIADCFHRNAHLPVGTPPRSSLQLTPE